MASFWIKILFGPRWTKSPTGPWMSLELQWSVVLQVIARYRDRDAWMPAYHMTLGKTQQTQDNEGKCEQYKNGFGQADFTE